MREIKKIGAVLFAVLFFLFSACGKGYSTEEHKCSFTQKVQATDYIKSEATCQNGAEYYYSCECGKRGDLYFSTDEKGSHIYTGEVVSEKYLKKAGTCQEQSIYYKSCAVCGIKSFAHTFIYGEKCDCNFICETVHEEYLATEPTFSESAQYYKSCCWCGAKGEETFFHGEPLKNDYTEQEKAEFMPTSLTVTMYDSQNSIYGFTYNTQVMPLRPMIQIEKGNFLTENCEEYVASVEEAKSYNTNDKEITYYIVKVEIPLEKNTNYAYRAYDKYVGVSTKTVVLKTRDTKSETFTFAHVSDSQGEARHFGDVLKNVTESSDFLVHTGDFVETSKYESEWNAMLNGHFDYLSRIPVMAISGNHETTYKNGANETYKHFNNSIPTQESTLKGYFYSFVYGNTKFIVLNTNDLTGNKLKSGQYDWLVRELQNNDCDWTIVAMHNPIYSIGKYGSNPNNNQICLALREQLQGVFAQYGVDIVLQGHDHSILRTKPIDGQGNVKEENYRIIDGVEYSIEPNGVIYVMNGPAGEQLRKPFEGADISFYKYAQASNACSWAEFSVDENSMLIKVKYYDGTQVQTYHTWGIKK